MVRKKIFHNTSIINVFLIILFLSSIPCMANEDQKSSEKKSSPQSTQDKSKIKFNPATRHLRRGIENEPIYSSDYNRYRDIIEYCSRKHGISTKFIHSVISVESDYNPKSVSHKGAVGLMQLMPETAKYYGVKDIYDPKQNIEGGVKYLKDLIKVYNGRTDLVLAAYNAGQEAIKKYKGIPPYPETRGFIQKVNRIYRRRGITFSTQIYTFHDSSGTTVFTNSRRLKSLNGEK